MPFILNYGYEGSVWHYCLSRQLPREPFYVVFSRATRRLAELVDGKTQEIAA